MGWSPNRLKEGHQFQLASGSRSFVLTAGLLFLGITIFVFATEVESRKSWPLYAYLLLGFLGAFGLVWTCVGIFCRQLIIDRVLNWVRIDEKSLFIVVLSFPVFVFLCLLKNFRR